MLSFNPAECQQRQIYKLMTGIIVPRPVALVSTLSRDGVANLAPFSFFCGVGSAPPTVLFCPALRPAIRLRPETGRKKRHAAQRRGDRRVRHQRGQRSDRRGRQRLLSRGAFGSGRVRALRADADRERSRPPAARRPVARADGVQTAPGHLHRPRAGAAASSCWARSSAFICARIWSRTSASIQRAWTPWAAWPATPGSAPATASN